ncbi:MAG TPA: PHB depolymerase family esterase [Gemmatales bacterium]|nr:PHB depolymerase family esterase [Gemmatales bacterium]HMP61221.1 PHB depolymerase family esterase [Gemmatales bacterium]
MNLHTSRLGLGSVRPERLAEGFYPSCIESARRQPTLSFLPTGYEPEYAYPLIVWFHGEGGSEHQLQQVLPQVSRRNYLGLALRGLAPVLKGDGSQGWSWQVEGADELAAEDNLFAALEDLEQHHAINSERIFLAGVGTGASFAYRLAFLYPERFAGVAAFNGQINCRGPLLRLMSVRRLKVFIGHGIANPVAPLSLAQRDHRLLYTAGLDVEFKTYATTQRLHPTMFQDLDRWAMGIVTESR